MAALKKREEAELKMWDEDGEDQESEEVWKFRGETVISYQAGLKENRGDLWMKREMVLVGVREEVGLWGRPLKDKSQTE